MTVCLVLRAMGHIKLSFGKSKNFFFLEVRDLCGEDVGPKKLVDCLYKLGWIFGTPGSSKTKLIKVRVST
jgi:hypothetical protein